MKQTMKSRQRSELTIPMTPMIDVVFLLLVFFVWTSSFQVEEMLLPSSIAATSGGGEAQMIELPPELEMVVVAMSLTDGEVNYDVSDRRFDNIDQLRQFLSAVVAIDTGVPVVVAPNENVPLGAVVGAYDVARLLGFGKVHFAVE